MPMATTIASRRWADKRMAHGSRSASFIELLLYGVDQPEDRRTDASDPNGGIASVGFFVNVRTFVTTLGWFCFDALRRKFANVLRMSVLALFL